MVAEATPAEEDVVIPSEAKDLAAKQDSRFFASLRMTLHGSSAPIIRP
jgi:hypothetical protein